jgi:hypothetical protein
MKIILGALALAIAVPSAAQTAPATDPHAGHAQHQQQGNHSQHGDHGKMAGEHADCCKEGERKPCCDKMKDGAAMDCCKEHAGGQKTAAEGHSH